ncbi:MAG TPA: hypothetical protein VG276_28010 [Actinomycetes bacterium]|jgi:hypothetical protein|nr:hypothetical protein [Actinomycetes bacterium]
MNSLVDYLAVCPNGHRSFLRLAGIAIPALGIEADPEIKGVCTTCQAPAQLHRLPPVR